MEQERAWQIATRVAVWIVGCLFVVLVVTGLLLTFRYRPSVSMFADVAKLEHRPVFTLRGVHRLVARLFLIAVGCLAIASVGLFIVRRRFARIAFPFLAGVLTLAASITGFLLPWDQLAMWQVTVGTNLQGYSTILHGHDVKYVLIGSTEVGAPTFQFWFWVHALVLPLLIVVVVAAITIGARRQKRSGSAV